MVNTYRVAYIICLLLTIIFATAAFGLASNTITESFSDPDLKTAWSDYKMAVFELQEAQSRASALQNWPDNDPNKVAANHALLTAYSELQRYTEILNRVLRANGINIVIPYVYPPSNNPTTTTQSPPHKQNIAELPSLYHTKINMILAIVCLVVIIMYSLVKSTIGTKYHMIANIVVLVILISFNIAILVIAINTFSDYANDSAKINNYAVKGLTITAAIMALITSLIFTTSLVVKRSI